MLKHDCLARAVGGEHINAAVPDALEDRQFLAGQIELLALVVGPCAQGVERQERIEEAGDVRSVDCGLLLCGHGRLRVGGGV